MIPVGRSRLPDGTLKRQEALQHQFEVPSGSRDLTNNRDAGSTDTPCRTMNCMTFVRADRVRDSHCQTAPRLIAIGAVLFVAVWVCTGSIALAQRAPVHYFHSSDLPPGAIGQGQLLRGGPLPGYFQPVEIKAPRGASISLAIDGKFAQPDKAPVLAGMLIGQVYRIKITGIPRNEGFEVFPTIEVINRMYPPPGLEKHFPVPIEFTLDELEMALSGLFVTRVIYLEDPNGALPVADDPNHQRYFEVRADEDPLKAADRLGRPMAIIRMGSRTPDYDTTLRRFAFAMPPLRKLAKPAPLPDRKSGLEEPALAPPGNPQRNVPRVPLPGPPPTGTASAAAWRVR